MTHLDPDLDSNPTVEPLSRVLDDDVLDLILSACVEEGVMNVLRETEASALQRQRRCRRLRTVSWQFAVSNNETETLLCVLMTLFGRVVDHPGSTHV